MSHRIFSSSRIYLEKCEFKINLFTIEFNLRNQRYVFGGSFSYYFYNALVNLNFTSSRTYFICKTNYKFINRNRNQYF